MNKIIGCRPFESGVHFKLVSALNDESLLAWLYTYSR